MADEAREQPRSNALAGPPTSRATGAGASSPWLALLVPMLAALYLATQYPYTLDLPFAGDDFVFLDRTKDASFASLWKTTEGGRNVLAFHYYRPISRELHYWTLTRLFGQWEPPFHLLSMILATAVAALYFVLVRRVAGTSVAAVATAAVLTLAAWGVLVVWVAGSQDLWMMGFALATLLALAHGRPRLAWLGFALALLSKETAAAVPAIAVVHQVAIERRPWRNALSRTAGLWVLLLIWAALHPLLGGQLRNPIREPTIPGLVQSPPWILGHNLLAVLNLDEWPRPVEGWASVLGLGLIGALIAGALAAIGLGKLPRLAAPAAEPARAGTGRIAIWGASWALIAWTPLLMPSLGWHAYYALFGMLGAWVALAALLAKRPAVALAVVAALALIRAGRANTKSYDWGNEWFQKRAALFGRETRNFFVARYPTLPAHSRIFLSNVPQGVGLVPGGDDSPAFRVWYQDPTLGTYFGSRYRPRRPDEPAGPDFLFVYDSTAGGWTRDSIVALPSNPTPADREAYARFMWRVQQFAAARAQYEELVRLEPGRWDHMYNLGSCIMQEGDSVTAVRWYERAAAMPGMPANIRRSVERSRRLLR